MSGLSFRLTLQIDVTGRSSTDTALTAEKSRISPPDRRRSSSEDGARASDADRSIGKHGSRRLDIGPFTGERSPVGPGDRHTLTADRSRPETARSGLLTAARLAHEALPPGASQSRGTCAEYRTPGRACGAGWTICHAGRFDTCRAEERVCLTGAARCTRMTQFTRTGTDTVTVRVLHPFNRDACSCSLVTALQSVQSNASDRKHD